ncbi:peptide chain release factor N(5)-glutamine methyltransferase [Actinoplanes sp. NPDC049265]|uniref:peptide chain release factor N(5)-glutamine methyltransferase n=1 Tax=Actinoplanes sp. NPDC049265 TaxID=3363902 RepID=UPI003714267D
MTPGYEHPSPGTDRTPLAPILRRAASDLVDAGVASPRTDAELLAAHVLGIGRGRLALVGTVRPDEAARLSELIARRAQRVPLQHLIGTAAFRHLDLAVGPGVFIPRPETELLAGWGIERTAPGATVVDLCSGSGAVACSVADETEAGRVIAVERSPEALVWLRRNAGSAVEVVEADVTDPGLLGELDGRVDVLLCNPPYVPDGTRVPAEVAEHDPLDAVFGGGDGLTVIRPVVAAAARLLRTGGALAIEHDDTQGDVVPALLRADGRFTSITAHSDLTGRPRFTTAFRGF